MNLPILVSFSGGRTSAFMARFINESPIYADREKVFVYANTGKEKEETLIFINECSTRWGLNVVWVEAVVHHGERKGTTHKVVNFETASRKGEPFEEVIKKYNLPSVKFPHCTRELKQAPILSYMKTRFKDWATALGIRADEPNRITQGHGRLKNPFFPLSDTLKVDEAFIRGWWERQDFDLKIKDYQGNCDLCYKKSKRKRLTLILEDPNIWKWWAEMETKHGRGHKWDARENLSIFDLLEESKKPFRRAVDKQEERNKTLSLFEPNYDIEFNCFCS